MGSARTSNKYTALGSVACWMDTIRKECKLYRSVDL